MSYGLLLSTSLASVAANKLRAGLTLLGIVIGVSSVITMMAIGRGAEVSVTDQISGLGSNLLTVQPGAQARAAAFFGGGSVSDLTLGDAIALADPIFGPDIKLVAPENSFSATAKNGRESIFVSGVGVTAEYLEARNLRISSGRNISAGDVKNSTLVAVLGSSLKETLFGQKNPVGTLVKIADREFTVVGVLSSQEGTGFNPDSSVLVPITTAHYRINGGTGASDSISVSSMNVLAIDENSVESARNQIRTILTITNQLGAGDEFDFNITSQKETLETLEGTQATFVILLGSIAGISLVVGGIGVMNIMLVSVTERTREIGIRRSIGAKKRDILLQFLLEATLMTLSGGLIGIFAGWTTAYFADGAVISGDTIETVIETHIALLALGVSVAVGLFFGIYPAIRAASLNPIEALRHE